MKKFIMEASPSNFRLRTVLENAFRVPWESERFPGAEWVNKKWELFKRPIPGHGIDIPGVLSVGLLASVWVGVEMTVAGGANFTWGFEGAIPESAKIMVDVLDRDKTYAEGFEGTTFNPILQLHSFEGTVRCSAGVSLKLTFGISLKKVGDYETGIRVLLPDWSSLVTGISSKSECWTVIFKALASLLIDMFRRTRCLQTRVRRINDRHTYWKLHRLRD